MPTLLNTQMYTSRKIDGQDNELTLGPASRFG